MTYEHRSRWVRRGVLYAESAQHSLLGTVVEVRALVHSNSPASARQEAAYERFEPSALLLLYADGRQVVVEPEGMETDGVLVREPIDPVELVD